MWFVNNVMTENEAIDIFFRSAEAKINYCWYLNVNVKSSEGTALENMKVEVYHTNGTLVDENTTDANGNAQFLLERHIWKNSTHEYFVQYKIKAYNTKFEGEKNVELNYLNEKITLTVNRKEPSQTDPEPTGKDYESLLIMSIIIITAAAATALLITFRKKRQKLSNQTTAST